MPTKAHQATNHPIAGYPFPGERIVARDGHRLVIQALAAIIVKRASQTHSVHAQGTAA